MTIQQFIEKARKGGWEGMAQQPLSIALHNGRRFGEASAAKIWQRSILLDPTFWQAVGKVEGWEGGEVQVQKVKDHGAGSNPRFYAETHTEIRPSPTDMMHRMVDSLCSGKSIEEFVATL